MFGRVGVVAGDTSLINGRVDLPVLVFRVVMALEADRIVGFQEQR